MFDIGIWQTSETMVVCVGDGLMSTFQAFGFAKCHIRCVLYKMISDCGWKLNEFSSLDDQGVCVSLRLSLSLWK